MAGKSQPTSSLSSTTKKKRKRWERTSADDDDDDDGGGRYVSSSALAWGWSLQNVVLGVVLCKTIETNIVLWFGLEIVIHDPMIPPSDCLLHCLVGYNLLLEPCASRACMALMPGAKDFRFASCASFGIAKHQQDFWSDAEVSCFGVVLFLDGGLGQYGPIAS